LQQNRSHRRRADRALYGDPAARGVDPAGPEIRQLQALVRRLDALQGMSTQELNRLAAGVTVAEVRVSIEAIIASLDAQIAHVQQLIRDHLGRFPGLRAQRDLLTTIPGIGEATAA